MQILKPLFAFFCAQLAIASPITTEEDHSVGLVERADPITISDAVKEWNKQTGVPGNSLSEGLYVFRAKYPRNEVKDQNLGDLVKEARNFLNANHYMLISVEIKKKETGPPKKRKQTLDVGNVNFWDIGVDDNNKVTMPKPAAAYDFARAEKDGVEHDYLKKLGSKVKKFSDITPIAKAYVEAHQTYDPKTNNCLTFVDEVAKLLS
ncbi:hypothetical protein F5Y05DRAFT_411307 [Hypoxylon sp. FL0543]|nr:hypothetical protein F5Y05DRAFT_411307 [Hypoxylon sp. FL0543]